MPAWFETDPDRRDLEIRLMLENTNARLRRTASGFEWTEDLVCEATLRPYRLLITYPASFPVAAPQAQIMQPNIEGAPHRLAANTLCLQANPIPSKSTALLIRNRAVVWFLVYEGWLRTGEWMAPAH